MGIEIHEDKDAVNLAISPCPNDTFIFGAWINGKIPTDLEPLPRCSYYDIEELNQLASNGEFDVIKVSAAQACSLLDRYVILNCGAALGIHNGPVLVGLPNKSNFDVTKNPIIALPGENTTAHFLFSFQYPGYTNKRFMLFSEIEESVLTGLTDFGVLIHEGRFTFEKKGLQLVSDLGQYWTDNTGMPIPLGVILAKKDLGHQRIHEIENVIRLSLQFQDTYPGKLRNYIQSFAQEMDEESIEKHIALYVNEYSYDLGDNGRQAIMALFAHISAEPKSAQEVFLI